MKHKKTAIALLFIVLLLIAAVIFTFWNANRQTTPVGTPESRPRVDQRPVPNSSTSEMQKEDSSRNQDSSIDSSKESPQSSISSSLSSSSLSASSLVSQDTQEKKVSGTVVDASTSRITVKTKESNQTLSFMRQSADVTGNIVEDAYVEIYYIGEIKDSDTSDVYVTKIICYP